jgi:ankyrin repeat protein
MDIIPLLVNLAYDGTLTVKQVNETDSAELKQMKQSEFTILFWACESCPVEVVQALLDKGLDVNELSRVCCSATFLVSLHY